MRSRTPNRSQRVKPLRSERASGRLGFALECGEHHLGVFADLSLERRADELGQGRDAEVVVDAERDARSAAGILKRPSAFELFEVALDQLVANAQRGVVEEVFFRPFDGASSTSVFQRDTRRCGSRSRTTTDSTSGMKSGKRSNSLAS